LQQLSFGAPLPQGHPIAGQGGQQPILNVSIRLFFNKRPQFSSVVASANFSIGCTKLS
jgi:hypothetical protein